MPDGPFKGMQRDPDSERIDRRSAAAVKCVKCGGDVYPGDWPYCKGRMEDHER